MPLRKRYIAVVAVALLTCAHALSRKRRHLLFGDGSNLIVRMAAVRGCTFVKPKRCQLLIENESFFKLPNETRAQTLQRLHPPKKKKKLRPVWYVKDDPPLYVTEPPSWPTWTGTEEPPSWPTWTGTEEPPWYVTETPTWDDYYYYHQDHHGRDRRELYTVVEDVLTAQGLDGKACILRAICEVHRHNFPSSLFHDIFRLAFSFSSGLEQLKEYEEANNASDCFKWIAACPLVLNDIALD